jgi:hypothetical protein
MNAQTSPRLDADAAQVGAFVAAIFKHAEPGTYVSLRIFDQVNRKSPIRHMGWSSPSALGVLSVVLAICTLCAVSVPAITTKAAGALRNLWSDLPQATISSKAGHA